MENVTFAWFDGSHYIAKFQVIVDCSLGFSISVYGWFIPDNHPLYMQYNVQSGLRQRTHFYQLS